MKSWLSPALAALGSLLPAALLAAPPVVTTVPADPNNAQVRHDVISGRPTTLKGAVDAACAGVCTWSWDPGDGSPDITGNVDASPVSTAELDDPGYNPYWAVWAEHTYTGAVGQAFTARLTVDNGVDPPVSATYRVEIRGNSLSNEVNAAIDEALWHMHRNQFRFLGTETGVAGGNILMGRWDYPQFFGSATVSVTAASVNAFEANGYLQTGPATSPYTDTVRLGLLYTVARLAAQPISVQTVGDITGNGRNDDPDTNGNGVGVAVDNFLSFIEFDPPYQNGMVMDAILASGTPNRVATTGGAGVIGETYGDIIQDMVDWYAWAQSDTSFHGGWQYNAFDNNAFSTHDNSASGWAAIGILVAEDIFGADVPDFVKERNELGLEFTDNESDVVDQDGIHGYSGTGPIWGAFGVTGAAMVQMSMDRIESTTGANPDERWIRSENFFRRHFDDPAAGDNFKNYYYGMFNFAKAMRTATPSPVIDIGTQVGFADGGVGCGPNVGCVAGGPQPLDWYNDPVSGLARAIVDYQILPGNPNTEGACGGVQPGPCPNIGGFTDRPGNSHGSSQDDHNVPWATQILTRSLFQAGPIAVAEASPNPTAENVPVTFDPSESFHQDPAHVIVLYEWDFDNDGVFDESTPGPTTVQESFVCPPPGVPCSFPVTLRVTDDNTPALTAEAVVTVEVTIPPHPPTAVSGGPYTVCVGVATTLDGSDSFDINEGTSETGNPPFDTITLYEWDLDLASGAPFDSIDETGATPSHTFATEGVFDIALRVTDNTAAAFPTAAQPDLTNTDSTTVNVVTCPTIDLSLTASADPTTVLVGQNSTLTFTVTNNGPEDSTGAIVTVLIPPDVTLGAATPDTGSCTTAGSVVCTLDPIAVGESVEITIIVTLDAAADFDFDGTADPANLDQDTDLSNNDATATVTAIPEAGDVDLAITATGSPGTLDPDEEAVATLTVTNNGPDDAAGAVVTATPSAGFRAESATTPGGTCTVDPDEVVCTLDPIAVDESVEIEVTVVARASGTQTVDASVATNGIDIDSVPGNNEDSVSFTVRDVIDITVNGKGGTGGLGLIDLLLLALAAPLLALARRRRAVVAGTAALVLASSLAFVPRAEAGNWYAGVSAGSTDLGTSSEEYRDALSGAGITPRAVSLDDSDSGFKAFGGYSFNEYFAIEAGYADLGEVESSFATTVPPNAVDSTVRTAANVHPYFAGGATLALVGKVPVGDRVELFAKGGAFMWDNTEVDLEVVSGATFSTSLDRDGSDAFYGAGVSLDIGAGWRVRGEWERYEIDDQDADFISFGVERRFGTP
jgi:uncharacterized repeat protein (TIGR01451 family)